MSSDLGLHITKNFVIYSKSPPPPPPSWKNKTFINCPSFSLNFNLYKSPRSIPHFHPVPTNSYRFSSIKIIRPPTSSRSSRRRRRLISLVRRASARLENSGGSARVEHGVRIVVDNRLLLLLLMLMMVKVRTRC